MWNIWHTDAFLVVLQSDKKFTMKYIQEKTPEKFQQIVLINYCQIESSRRIRPLSTFVYLPINLV